MAESAIHLRRGLFGLQFRTTALLAVIVVVATGLCGWTYARFSSSFTLAESRRHTTDVARAIAFSSGAEVAHQDRTALTRTAQACVSQGEMAYLVFTDITGEILASCQRGAGNINSLLVDGTNRVLVDPINQPRLLHHGEFGPRIDIVFPVTVSNSEGSSLSTPTVGFVRLGVSMASADARLARLRQDIIWLCVAVALLMVPIGFQAVRVVIAPINRLAEAVTAFAAGQRDVRVAVSQHEWGEIADLKRAFNGMADQLNGSHEKLVKLNAELEDRVRERTLDLERANMRLAEMASRDSLTGLYNRRHFNDVLAQLFAEAARYNTEITCMMLDLDNFKQVNDTLGHHMGDQLLQITSEVLLACIREADVPVRYGGDEFAVLFPRTTPAEATASAERILTRFKRELLRRMPDAHFVSLSVGLASREDNLPATCIELVHLADEALYKAKAAGKNQIKSIRPSQVRRNPSQQVQA